MKKILELIGWLTCVVLLAGAIMWLYRNENDSSTSQPLANREVIQMPLTAESKEEFSVPATKLPEFAFDVSDSKFQKIAQSSKDGLKDYVDAKISYTGDAQDGTKIEAEVDLNAEKHKLIVHPKDLPNFKPGKYRLHLSLRTLEGEVNVEQDFTWGVIAVNTNRSIYEPGNAALISMGVLNDAGETQCMTGEASAKVWLTITDPNGVKKEYSTEDKTIKDSGECSAISVTNNADFQALFLVATPGIHQMRVVAEIKGKKREIEDYFKVEKDPAFDVERYSFPTRIYPKAPYNVMFKVTAKEDYSGPMEETVPENFKISNIGQSGKEETDGGLKKIIWNVNLKKGKTQEFTYKINFPLISPEFYLMGPIKIGSFQEARQWQVASDAINSTSGVIAYEDNGGSITLSRVWTGATSVTYPQGWNPDPPTTATNMGSSVADGRWFVEKSSPKTGEKTVAVIDEVAANDRLLVLTWNGLAWGGSPSVNVALSSTAGAVTRSMDVAYEEESGDAIVVYSNYSSNQLLHFKKIGTTWDAVASNAGAPTAVYKRWVRLEAQANSDNILVGYLNNDERVGAMIWDGASNTFGNQLDDTTGTQTATSDEQAFDIAIETNSGTPMIFWGGAANNNIIYREFSSGVWQAEVASAINTTTTDVDWLFAAADPLASSNNIALAIQESAATPICRFAVWTGAAITYNATTVTCVSNATNNLIDVAFENNSSKAVWVYITSAASSQMSWLTWTSGGGFTTGAATPGTSTNIEGIQLHTDLNTTSMIALYHDNSGAGSVCQLWDRKWDGTSWSAKDTDPIHANLCATADNDTLPYGFGFDRNLETLAAYRWFSNSANLGASLTALTTLDSPYTLTTANQQFRLRLLVYYPDSLAINGRQYKLQFVDPGTGTCAAPTGGTPAIWTDVPAPGGGSQITFYDNAGLNDADNLASNASDPTYSPYTKVNQDYEEANNFTNSASAMAGDQVGLWDFSLVDMTTYDRNAQSFCFRVARSNDLVLQIAKYPQINTAAISDVLIKGGSRIQSGTRLQ